MHVSVCSYGQWCRPLLFETNAKPIPMHWELDWLNMNLNKCTHISTHMRCHIFFNLFFSASSLFICLTVLCIRFARMHTILSNGSRQFHNSKKRDRIARVDAQLCIFFIHYHWVFVMYFFPSRHQHRQRQRHRLFFVILLLLKCAKIFLAQLDWEYTFIECVKHAQ